MMNAKQVPGGNEPLTLINVFQVDPARQEQLVELLKRATDGIVNAAPGFITSTLHRSLDGTKVAMYSRWRSNDDYQAMRGDPRPRALLEEALSIAKFEPGIYEVVQTYLPLDDHNPGDGD
jgi:heme-degrading monooxygenase HmoA